ncbi:MAG: site-2 protease family protein [Oscillospiraceae bacterium]|nr:site-2 protease family protein [Oscillospiraceae bacterium]
MNYLTNLWQALDLHSLLDLVLRLVSVLLCLCVHELCHALCAYALGDPTAKLQHRLSLNPLRHIDWFGFAMLAVAGFGWAKPVPVNPGYFKRPKLGMALTALAGPVSNLLLAFLLLVGTRLLWDVSLDAVTSFLLDTALLSTGLGLFNLLPIPPLDGSKVLFALLPDRQYRWLMRYERVGMVVLLVLVAAGVGSSVLNKAIYAVFLFMGRLAGL